jgi:wyosine [tRNA(Phe)-imidazoG37] synthetase (radical SAM superfamily)
MGQPESDPEQSSLYKSHPRTWRENRYVYPVISRRSRGLSIGINLTPTRVCNFNCVYCQVDRSQPPAATHVDLDRLREELQTLVRSAQSGDLFETPPFDKVKDDARQIRDLAFSGDGEPTLSPLFGSAVKIAADIRREFHLDDTRLVLITNASCLDRADVRSAVKMLHENNGIIWAKLDAGTESLFQRIARAHISLRRIVENLKEVSCEYPVEIQSLWMNIDHQPPGRHDIEAFAQRLNEITQAGGQIQRVQIYTIARPPAEESVSPLEHDQLTALAGLVESKTNLPVEVF